MRLSHIDRLVDLLRERGVEMEETAHGKLRISPPSLLSVGELEQVKAHKAYILSRLRGDELHGEHIEASEPVLPEPEPPSPEPAEPEPAEVDEHDEAAQSAPVASPRDGVLWGGGQLKRPARAGEPTREDFLLGDAVVQKQANGMYELVWANHDAEMSAMLRRGPRLYEGGE